jgi:proteasome accessory factor A
MQEERIGWDDPWLASLDLEYHNVNPDRGLFLGLEAEGKAWRMTSEHDVESALVVGPADTRAGIRGLCVRRFPDQIKSMQWERIQFSGGLLPRTLEMGDLFEPQAVQACAPMPKAPSPSDEGGGPKRPETGSPDKDNLLKRMRKVDPKQAERYRQRTGQ